MGGRNTDIEGSIKGQEVEKKISEIKQERHAYPILRNRNISINFYIRLYKLSNILMVFIL